MQFQVSQFLKISSSLQFQVYTVPQQTQFHTVPVPHSSSRLPVPPRYSSIQFHAFDRSRLSNYTDTYRFSKKIWIKLKIDQTKLNSQKQQKKTGEEELKKKIQCRQIDLLSAVPLNVRCHGRAAAATWTCPSTAASCGQLPGAHLQRSQLIASAASVLIWQSWQSWN